MDNQAGVARTRAKNIREAWAEVDQNAGDTISIADSVQYLKNSSGGQIFLFIHWTKHTDLLNFPGFFSPSFFFFSSTLKPHSPKTAMAPIKILIINPNTNQSMTDTLRAPIESLGYNNVRTPFQTASSDDIASTSLNLILPPLPRF